MLSAYFFNDDGTCTHYKNGRRSLITSVRGPVDVLSHVRTRARSLHFGHCGLVVGSLPSRALVQMSLCDNTSPPPISLANRL